MQSIFQHDGGLPDDVDSCDPEIFGTDTVIWW